MDLFLSRLCTLLVMSCVSPFGNVKANSKEPLKPFCVFVMNFSNKFGIVEDKWSINERKFDSGESFRVSSLIIARSSTGFIAFLPEVL